MNKAKIRQEVVNYIKTMLPGDMRSERIIEQVTLAYLAGYQNGSGYITAVPERMVHHFALERHERAKHDAINA